MLRLWRALDVPPVVITNALTCSRSHLEADENNFDQVLSEPVVNQYDSSAKWKTA